MRLRIFKGIRALEKNSLLHRIDKIPARVSVFNNLEWT